MDFAKNLQKLRKNQNLSQEELADQLHISRQAISKWEMGQSTPDIETCLKLCEILKVTPNRLLLGVEDDIKNEQQEKQSKAFFVFYAVFLIMILVCGTVMLICNLYNGEIFEPNIHTQALIMIRGSVAVFLVTFILYLLREKYNTAKSK